MPEVAPPKWLCVPRVDFDIASLTHHWINLHKGQETCPRFSLTRVKTDGTGLGGKLVQILPPALSQYPSKPVTKYTEDSFLDEFREISPPKGLEQGRKQRTLDNKINGP